MISNKILILGNGFDLAIGRRTTYNDFYKSSFWPFNKRNQDENSLRGFLNVHHNIDKWFDLESLLGNYAMTRTNKVGNGADYGADADKQDFDTLVHSLKKYLEGEQNKSPQKSFAFDTLTKFGSGFTNNRIIYSFNYTNVPYENYIGNNQFYKMIHVHGSLEEDNMILGYNSMQGASADYEFLRKTFNPLKPKTHIKQDLANANHVYFYGHSLSKMDFLYFKDYFTKQSNVNYEQGDVEKHTWIITNTEKSIQQIYHNISSVGIDIDSLINNYNFHVLATELNDNKKSKELIEDIEAYI